MPVTFWTFLIASLAISGFPLLAGFWSKDEILWKAFDTHALVIPGPIIWLMGIIAAGFTAFYMTRLVVLTFLGEPRFEKKEEHQDEHAAHDAHDAHGHGHHGTPHESPPSMTMPLIILAGLSVIGGFIGMGAWTHMPNWFESWLAPVFSGEHGHEAAEHVVPIMEYVMVAVSIGVGLGGIFLGLKVYLWGKGRAAEAFAARYPEAYELVRDKYRVDEIYQAAIVNPLLDLNEVLGRTDNVVIDGAVNKSASVTASVSTGTGFFDNEVVDGAVNATARASQAAARSARRLQTGHIRQYLTTALVGGLLVIGLFTLWTYRDVFRGYLGLN
jgi:NADH-quinone oxidoreductase subunit L